MNNKNCKVAFYIMNSKGYYVLVNFLKKFGNKNIDYIVSSKDKGLQKDFFEEIKNLAESEKIHFFDKNDNFIDIENNFNGFKFVIGWRWIIKNEKNLIVFHDSYLPYYRGFAPLVNALINEEEIIGITALFASKEYDKGDIVAQKSFKITYPIKIVDLIKIVEPVYFELVEIIFIKILNNEKLISSMQIDDNATYSLWLNEDDYFIDWRWNAQKIKRFVDSVGYPYDNAKAYLNHKIIKFIDVEVLKDVSVIGRERQIGKVIFFDNSKPVIVCKEGLIRLNDIRDCENNKIFINFRSRFK